MNFDHCYGCGKEFRNKRGLSNHHRVCSKWKNFDGVRKLKKRRLKTQTLSLGTDSGPTPDAPEPMQLDTIADINAPVDIPPPSEVPPVPQTSTRSGRSVRFPRRYLDYLPSTRKALARAPSRENLAASCPGSPSVSSPASSGVDTPRNDLGLEPIVSDPDCFGIYQVYSRNVKPPPGTLHDNDPIDTQSTPATIPYYHPFSNPSAAAMMVTHHLGTPLQSVAKTTQIANILGSLGSDLNYLDLLNFDATLENKKLDRYLTGMSGEDGWLETSIRIRLPLDKAKMLESDAAELEVEGLFYRDIVDVISSVYQSDVVRSFSHVPFKQFWKPSEESPPERLYGELFTSQAMLDADDEVSRLCASDSDTDLDLETAVVSLILYSDSTHLANFGTASCWPVYLFFGGQSKYVRDKPTSNACHHIAYMPKVSPR
jgi:hypothetical protein